MNLSKTAHINDFQKLQTNGKVETYNFIISGVAVSVSGKAKNLHIATYSMVGHF